ncbi:MAG: trehalase family glycosidase [Candidatus Acidiferrales bacterium]
MDDLLRYISVDWDRLTRSLSDCATYPDRKTDGGQILYFPAGATIPASVAEIQMKCSVRVEHLPAKLHLGDAIRIPQTPEHGLLYLENPYVVPGGQFNEMYGWDSYFIIRGLLRSNREDLAKGMVENFFYEIENYGGVLNANRTYYLGRSQPPFLTSMILAVYQVDQAAGKADVEWLRRAYKFAVTDYSQWTLPPHLAGDTGLSRYFDEGDGPVPEIMGDPVNYYRGVAHYFLIHEGEDGPHLVRVDANHPVNSILGPVFQVPVCDPGANQNREPGCTPADRVGLTPDDYKGDRSMRESGFDVSFRFGPYGVDTHQFAPVCLNSLLYKTEMDLAEMSRLLGQPNDAAKWKGKAAQRREKVVKYLWNERRGFFFDYNFVTHAQSSYEYATTFYPLWSGLASKEQARAVAQTLPLFEQPGGLAMSRYESQAQWDYPYGWAPIHLLALEGLRRYGYSGDADRVTGKFLTMILENFRRDHTIREKYNVVTRSSETHIAAGYAQNVTGFGWTNAVFLELLHAAPPAVIAQIRKD